MAFENKIKAEAFRDWVEDLGALGPVAYIIVLGLSVLFAPIQTRRFSSPPGWPGAPVLGTIYSMAGLMLGSAMAFYFSRRMGRRSAAAGRKGRPHRLDG